MRGKRARLSSPLNKNLYSMNKKTLLKTALIPSIGMAILSITSASAMMFGPTNISADELATRQASMFQQQAEIIGVSVDEVKAAWASGKDLKTLASEKGISMDTIKQKMETKRLEAQKATLATLVQKGVITQAQADQRIATMNQKAASGKKGEGRHGMRGFGIFGM